MRLLMLPRYGELGASSRLRMFQYLPALEDAGITVNVAPLLDDDYVRELYAGAVSIPKVAKAYFHRFRQMRATDAYDVVWLEKEIWPWLPQWPELSLLQRNCSLIVDYDDAVFHRYDMHRSALVRRILGRKIDAVMRRAQRVTAGNDYLARRAHEAGAACVDWLPTVVDLERYRVSPKTYNHGAAIIVGWIGSPSTAEYLHLLTPVLGPLRDAGLIRCVAIGARADQLIGTPFVAERWEEATEVVQLQRIDIGIMPLPDQAWEQGKCGYKLIQYMACGLPVVASAVGANNQIVKKGESGFLASTLSDWRTSLEQLISDPALRTRMGSAGRVEVEQKYSIQAQAPRLIALLRDAARGSVR